MFAMLSYRVNKLQAGIFFPTISRFKTFRLNSTQLKSQHYFSPLQNANTFKIQQDANEYADI